MNISVTKRDGSKTPYDASKIKKSIALACEGVDVNPLELESKIDLFLKSGIKTSEIQANVIQHALQLASSRAPAWLIVAGKALAMEKWAAFKLRDKSFNEIVAYNVKHGYYNKDLLSAYTQEQMTQLGRLVDHNRDLQHSHASLVTGYAKYIGPHELNQHMHMVNAMRFGQLEPADTRMEFVKSAYDILSLRELSLATPFMSNLRQGGNVASCFVLAIGDDLDSIFDNVHAVAKISKNGGGVGVFVGNIRAKGSSVNGHKNAAGPVTQWIKILNDTAVAVNQNGKRSGAVTVALPVWHNDIQEFLDMQTEHGDVRLKSFDVFPQITVPDLFMKRTEASQPWTTFCPFEVKTKLGIDMYGLWGEAFEQAYTTIEAAAAAGKLDISRVYPNARDLMKIVMRSMFDTGLPYVTFVDELNRHNPNKHDGFIPCLNLCTESTSNVLPDVYAHVCNLASINLGNIHSMERLADVARISTRMLDYGITMTKNPLPMTAAHNQRYRTIGIGIMGLHDNLAMNFSGYHDVDRYMDYQECIAYNSALESARLARRFGAFDAFRGSDWDNGARIAEYKKHTNGKYDWNGVQELVNEVGIRNSQMLSPAPTTSSSLYQDASATYLPVYTAFFAEDNKNGLLKVAAKYLHKNPVGYGKTQIKFDPKEIVDLTANLQKFIDTGISMELVFDQNKEGFSAKQLYETIVHAHASKVKSIYYIRTIKKNAQPTRNEPDCVACSG